MLGKRLQLFLTCLAFMGVGHAQYFSEGHCHFMDRVEHLKESDRYEEALALCNHRLASLNSNQFSPELFSTLKIKSRLFFDKNQYKEATAQLRPLKNVPVKNDEAYKAVWADCMYALARAYDYNNNVDSALYFFKLALNARLDLSAPDPRKLASNYSYLGYIHCFIKKNFGLAENYYLAEKDELEKFDATKEDWVRHYLNIAATFAERDYEKSLNHCFKGLSFVTPSTDLYTHQNLYNNIANLWFRQKKFQRAITYYTKALQLSEGVNVDDRKRVLLYENLGSTYLELGNYDSANYYLEQALALNVHMHGQSSPEVAETQYLLCQATSDIHKARQLRRVAIKSKRRYFKSSDPEMTRVFWNIGKWFERQGQLDSALHYYHIATRNDRQIDNYLDLPAADFENSIHIIGALRGKARMLFKLGKSSDSIELITSAVEHYKLISNVNQNFLVFRQSEAERLNFVKSIRQDYNQAVEASYFLYLHKGKGLEEVWDFIEKSKSAVLLIQAHQADEESYPEAYKQLLVQRRSLVGKAKYYDGIIESNQSAVDSIRPMALDLNKKIDSLNALLGDSDKRLSGNMQPLSIGLSEARKRLLKGEDQYLVQYYFTDKCLYVFKLGKLDSEIHELKGSGLRSLRRQIEGLREELVKGMTSEGKSLSYRNFTKYAAALYSSLIDPLNIHDSHSLIIIPDGPLAGIPFEVLLTDSSQGDDNINYRKLPYLIRTNRISYGYSASWLGMSEGPEEGLDLKSMKLLAVAYSAKSAPKASILKEKIDLPGSLKEISALRSTWGTGFTSVVGQEASEQRFKSLQPNYQLIHLATHNDVDTTNVLNSGLIFRKNQKDQEDGVLHIYEIYQLAPNAKMVVLSSCESGIGQYHSGEGFLSVGRAFAQIGTPFIISSLWKSSDVFSNKLMDRFYGEIKKGVEPSEALYQSKVGVLAEGDEFNSHPANWASYIMMGNPNVSIRTTDHFRFSYLIYVSLGLILVLIIFRMIKKTTRQGI